MKFLFLFLDGIGLGSGGPASNPFARVDMPRLKDLLEGRALLASAAPYQSQRATLLALDACLGVEGLPQSATGQATLLTGANVPAGIGRHYGPKPNPEVAEYIRNGNLFATLRKKGHSAALLNAYPPRYFEAIQSGLRLYSAIPLAVTSAGIPLKTAADFFAGRALSADFTGEGWRERLDYPEAPVLSPYQVGEHLAQLARQYDFAFYEVWMTDYAGHMQDMASACSILETFDGVLDGLLDSWDDQAGLIFITSDHGNMEDLSTRRHTSNPVPGLAIGAPGLRRAFTEALKDIAGVAPAILQFYS
jgi:hypothetical protein